VQLANAKTAEDRAKVDLKLHFMKKTLDEPVSCLQHMPGHSCSNLLVHSALSGNLISLACSSGDTHSFLACRIKSMGGRGVNCYMRSMWKAPSAEA
jgi:tRNA A37 threonylcarbamoyltransferase TsaD